MADISRYLNAILAAVYGEEVRGSIHDAINVINDEVSSSTSKFDNVVQVANQAKAQADLTVVLANNAVETANAANLKSDNAVATANAALDLAQIAKANSVEALRLTTESMELSTNVRNRVVNIEKIVNEYNGYTVWFREHLEMVDQTTKYITFDDSIQDSDENNVLDSNGDIIGGQVKGFAAFIRRTMELSGDTMEQSGDITFYKQNHHLYVKIT